MGDIGGVIGGLVGAVVFALFVVGIPALVIRAIRNAFVGAAYEGASRAQREQSPLAILDRRVAEGQIDCDQYEQARRALGL